MKKFLGYSIKVISLFLFLILVLTAINTIFFNKNRGPEKDFEIVFYFGVLFGFSALSWLYYKLFKLGSKIISKSRTQNEIKEIGQV